MSKIVKILTALFIFHSLIVTPSYLMDRIMDIFKPGLTPDVDVTIPELFREGYDLSRALVDQFIRLERGWDHEYIPEDPTARGFLLLYVWTKLRPNPAVHWEQVTLRFPFLQNLDHAREFFLTNARGCPPERNRTRRIPRNTTHKCSICGCQLLGYSMEDHSWDECPFQSLNSVDLITFIAINSPSYCNKCHCRSTAHLPDQCEFHKPCRDCGYVGHMEEFQMCFTEASGDTPASQERQLEIVEQSRLEHYHRMLQLVIHRRLKYRTYGDYPITSAFGANRIVPEAVGWHIFDGQGHPFEMYPASAYSNNRTGEPTQYLGFRAPELSNRQLPYPNLPPLDRNWLRAVGVAVRNSRLTGRVDLDLYPPAPGLRNPAARRQAPMPRHPVPIANQAVQQAPVQVQPPMAYIAPPVPHELGSASSDESVDKSNEDIIENPSPPAPEDNPPLSDGSVASPSASIERSVESVEASDTHIHSERNEIQRERGQDIVLENHPVQFQVQQNVRASPAESAMSLKELPYALQPRQPSLSSRVTSLLDKSVLVNGYVTRMTFQGDAYDLMIEESKPETEIEWCAHIRTLQVIICGGENPDILALIHESKSTLIEYGKFLLACGAELHDDPLIMVRLEYTHEEAIKARCFYGSHIIPIPSLNLWKRDQVKGWMSSIFKKEPLFRHLELEHFGGKHPKWTVPRPNRGFKGKTEQELEEVVRRAQQDPRSLDKPSLWALSTMPNPKRFDDAGTRVQWTLVYLTGAGDSRSYRAVAMKKLLAYIAFLKTLSTCLGDIGIDPNLIAIKHTENLDLITKTPAIRFEIVIPNLHLFSTMSPERWTVWSEAHWTYLSEEFKRLHQINLIWADEEDQR